ncbi:MAG TPA: ubiquitin-like domain-containing protein [Dehalococcoidia bacterium]|nr:ubiquitin-like domain-containing protein [Dehalococcoidia bacterium]
MTVSIAVVAVLGYVVFPPRSLSINADGSETAIKSRQKNISSLLDSAGIEQEAGDVLLKSGKDLMVERAIPVVVEADGRMLAWRTRAPDVEALLDELAIGISPYDTITYNGIDVRPTDTIYPGPIALRSLAGFGAFPDRDESGVFLKIKRAVPLTIVEDGREFSVQSSRPSVADALAEAGIRLGPADEVFPPVSSDLTAGMAIDVRHAKAISLRTGSSTRVIYTQQEYLKEALSEIGLNFGADDRVEPGLDAPVTDGMSARLVRVAGRTFLEKEPVLRKTVFKSDPNLSGFDSRVAQGRDGTQITEYHVTIEDGEEVEKNVVRRYFDPEPVNTIIYFAEASARAIDLPADNFDVRKVEHMYATWYNAASSGKAATDPAYGITASGRPLVRGIVAVDPSVIPLGTRLWIPGYGFAIAADTGGGIIGNMIDLGYPDGVPVDWRTGWVDVYILG